MCFHSCPQPRENILSTIARMIIRTAMIAKIRSGIFLKYFIGLPVLTADFPKPVKS